MLSKLKDINFQYVRLDSTQKLGGRPHATPFYEHTYEQVVNLRYEKNRILHVIK